MSLVEKLNQDFLTAFKGKQETVVSVLRMLKAALTNKEIEKKLPKGDKLADDEVIAVIKSEIKKRKDSYQSYIEAKRQELADKEAQEITVLEKYLPEQMSEEAIKEIVLKTIKESGAIGSADFGKVMGKVMAQTKNQADGQLVTKIVKAELSR